MRSRRLIASWSSLLIPTSSRWTRRNEPLRDPRSYAGNPYSHPSGSTGQGGASGQCDPFDPFTGWPFGGATQGQTTYVWTSWDDIFSGASGGQRTGSGQAGASGTGSDARGSAE